MPLSAHCPTYQQLLNQHSLLDSWRKQNPNKRQYTHYSHPHKQFSRIDHLLTNFSTSPLILNSLIMPCTWSDHNALMTTFSSLIPRSNNKTWYINDSLLSNPTYRQDIETSIQDYISNNTSTDIDPLTIWEALKPFIRGVCISQASYHRKLKQLHIQLDENFSKSSENFQNMPSPENKLAYDKAKLELDLFLTDSAEKILHKSKHADYMKANKPNTFLALSLRRTDYIPKPI